jgi:mannose-1-phosphate guanylyltransferase
MMSSKLVAVIMAGGGGTRLWPVSRQSRPKQILPLWRNQSLFQLTIERLRPLLPLERILVVTAQDQVDMLREQVPEIPSTNFIVEPVGRGTASAIGLAAIVCQETFPGSVMACLPSDHYIEDDERFRELLQQAAIAAAQDLLVTFGIPPAYPSTGYGYIERGRPLQIPGAPTAHEVKGFREKPSLDVARTLVESGQYEWNSGMFVWQVDTILAEIARQMPVLGTALRTLEEALPSERPRMLAELWPELAPETIDYGVMEGAAKVAMLSAGGLGWTDIGSWESLSEIMVADEAGNVLSGPAILALDARDSLIMQWGEPKHLLAAVGIKDLIVVDTGDAILIVPADQSERVRELVQMLEASERGEYLK